MRKQWDKWGWAVAIAVCGLVVFRAAWGRNAFCGSDSEHCLREWVSALGGWAAVAAAVPTVLYLSHQVRDAQRHHDQSIAIQLRRTRALAHRTRRAASTLAENSIFWMHVSKEEILREAPHAIPHLGMNIAYMNSVLQNKSFELFEEEVAAPEVLGIGHLQKIVSSMTPLIELNSHDPEFIVGEVESIDEKIRAYAREVVKLCDAFLLDPTH